LRLAAYCSIAPRGDIEGAGGICALLFLAVVGSRMCAGSRGRGVGRVRIALVGVRGLLGGLLGRILAVAVVGSRHGELGRATLQQRVSVARENCGRAMQRRQHQERGRNVVVVRKVRKVTDICAVCGLEAERNQDGREGLLEG
jgi:hypothetical protein